MVTHLNPEPIHIHIIHDLLLIELNDFNHETVYTVKNEEDRTVRQGKFRGHAIQLNLTHLPSGHYCLGLNHDEEIVLYSFEKNDCDYIFTSKASLSAKECA